MLRLLQRVFASLLAVTAFDYTLREKVPSFSCEAPLFKCIVSTTLLNALEKTKLGQIQPCEREP